MFFSETSTLQWYRLWWTFGWCWVAITWYLSLMASPPMPHIDFAYTDKIYHCLGYAWLMGWFGNIYHRPLPRLSYAVFLVTMGVAIEFIQGMSHYRQYEIADMVANTIGVGFGFVLTLGPMRLALRWVESRFIGLKAQ